MFHNTVWGFYCHIGNFCVMHSADYRPDHIPCLAAHVHRTLLVTGNNLVRNADTIAICIDKQDERGICISAAHNELRVVKSHSPR